MVEVEAHVVVPRENRHVCVGLAHIVQKRLLALLQNLDHEPDKILSLIIEQEQFALNVARDSFDLGGELERLGLDRLKGLEVVKVAV